MGSPLPFEPFLPAHFAFLRAVIQGMDPRQAWSRYLGQADEVGTARKIRQMVARFNDAYAVAARRHRQGGPARLIVLDGAGGGVGSTDLPLLAEFSRVHGLESFSEREQLESYRERFGAALQQQERHARRVRLRLAALRWFEQLAPEQGAAADGLHRWLAPAFARRLEQAGLHRLGALQQRIALRPARWWHGIGGIGAVKAARIAAQVAAAEAPLAAADLWPTAVRLRPLEALAAVEPALGEAGRLATRPGCRIAAATDLEALRAWLFASRDRSLAASDRADPGSDVAADGRSAAAAVVVAKLDHTRRAYWKEAERFQLWLYLARQRTLSSATATDCLAYLDFLRAPDAGWCGVRGQRRDKASWRPFTGPLAPAAHGFAAAVLRALYRYLVRVGYLPASPWPDRPPPAAATVPAAPTRAMAPAIPAPAASREAASMCCVARRVHLAQCLQRDFGLTAAALVRLTTADLLAPPSENGQWQLRHAPHATRRRGTLPPAVGTGAALRPDTMAALREHLAGRGIVLAPTAAGLPPLPLLGRAGDAAQRAPWAPCARARFDAASGIGAGTLRDQMRQYLHRTDSDAGATGRILSGRIPTAP